MDGVIADLTHRLPLVKDNPYHKKGWKPDYDTFFSPEQTFKDKPYEATVALMNAAYRDGMEVIILTARPEYTRNDTVLWLIDNDVNWDGLVMRPNGDHSKRKAADWKLETMKDIMEDFDVIGFYDDSKRNVEAVASLGVPAYHYGVDIR